jgi:hypothetical protein
MFARFIFAFSLCASLSLGASAHESSGLLRSTRSGPWSVGATWEGGHVPGVGARVQVRSGHVVTYDLLGDAAIRSIHVAGTLTFATDRATRLDVGLIKIQAGDDASEDGFTCDAHVVPPISDAPRPALEVGTPDRPIAPDVSALIRLVPFDGMDEETCPAIVCCGGRMDFHGAPMSRAWVKLGETARAGEERVVLAEPVSGWKVGDRIIITASKKDGRRKETLRPGAGGRRAFTEERAITAIDGDRLALDRLLAEDHLGTGDYRAEVANLSRNVVVESADPDKSRGHTMYHCGSSGSISYAEFRHLGKEGILGKYSLHFHLVGDTMRGSSVVGASIWDSGNRWITIHGTDYLVVRDCVGYQAVGHGFYLEDGTETDNVLDRNLAVQAFAGKPLPGQTLPFDRNEGAGFWWANNRNTLTRNVAVECDRYGFRYEATPSNAFDLHLPVRQSDGRRESVDIRTLSFVRFDDNEAHSQVYGLNLGEGVDGVGPDPEHPLVVRRARFWDCYWAFRPDAPSIAVEEMDIYLSRYGVYVATYDPRARFYGRVRFKGVSQTGIITPGPQGPNGEILTPPAPSDDRPPATVITSLGPERDGRRLVRVTTSDDGTVRRVTVNGREARATGPNFAEWEAVLDVAAPGAFTATARAEDEAGNVEATPHVVTAR